MRPGAGALHAGIRSLSSHGGVIPQPGGGAGAGRGALRAALYAGARRPRAVPVGTHGGGEAAEPPSWGGDAERAGGGGRSGAGAPDAPSVSVLDRPRGWPAPFASDPQSRARPQPGRTAAFPACAAVGGGPAAAARGRPKLRLGVRSLPLRRPRSRVPGKSSPCRRDARGRRRPRHVSRARVGRARAAGANTG